MHVMSDAYARENLESIMTEVCERREPVAIARDSGQTVIVISLEDFNSLEETAYLLRSTKNAQRLFSAIVDLESRN